MQGQLVGFGAVLHPLRAPTALQDLLGPRQGVGMWNPGAIWLSLR